MQSITPQVRLMTYEEAAHLGLHNRSLCWTTRTGVINSIQGQVTKSMFLPGTSTFLC